MNRIFFLVIAILGGGLVLLIMNDEAGQTFGLPNGSFASMVGLLAWGTVLAVAIVGSGRHALGDVARNLAIWLFIALLLVAGYQYRYELQDVASRVTAGLIPGSPLSISDANGGIMVMLEKSNNGHFEARGAINGVAVSMMVDTGASATVLTAADAERAGYDPASLSYNVPVSTANGVARAARVVAKDIAVGQIVRTNVPMLVAERGMLEQSLLGMNFIGTLSGFDVRGDRLVLRD
jgi:aspartyl protease family protein